MGKTKLLYELKQEFAKDESDVLKDVKKDLSIAVESKIRCKMILCYYQQDIWKHANADYFDEIIDKSSVIVHTGNYSTLQYM